MRLAVVALNIALFLVLIGYGQTPPPFLTPAQPRTFQLTKNQTEYFRLELKQNGYAEIIWLVGDETTLVGSIYDSSGRLLDKIDSRDNDSIIFVAPRDGVYLVGIQLTSDTPVKRTVSVELVTKFQLPEKSKQIGQRLIAGHIVRIFHSATSEKSTVVVEKAGTVRRVLKRFGGLSGFVGFFFADQITNSSPKNRRSSRLISSTLDKTGDGIPDVMLDYFSGGAHCCWETYFLNLGPTVDLVESIDVGHSGIIAIGVNPKGGLIFETGENAFAYWNTSFANSPLPDVILVFSDNNLVPDFELMRKRPPPLSELRRKAQLARAKMDLEPYTGVDSTEFEVSFWGEMLELIYSGNETLAWQYFELVWPSAKPGKNRFIADFNEQLMSGYWGIKSKGK